MFCQEKLFSRMNDIFAKDTNKTLQKRPVVPRKRPETAATAKETPSPAIRKRKLKDVTAAVAADQSKAATKVKDESTATDAGAAAAAAPPLVMENNELSQSRVKVEEEEEKEVSNDVVVKLDPPDPADPLYLADKAAAVISVAGVVELKLEEPATNAKAEELKEDVSELTEASSLVPEPSEPLVTASAGTEAEDSVMDVVSDDDATNVSKVVTTIVPDESVMPSAGPTTGTNVVTDTLERLSAGPSHAPSTVHAATVTADLSLVSSSNPAVTTAQSAEELTAAATAVDQSPLPVVTAVSSELTKSLRKVRLTKKAAAAAAAAVTPMTTTAVASSPAKLPLKEKWEPRDSSHCESDNQELQVEVAVEAATAAAAAAVVAAAAVPTLPLLLSNAVDSQGGSSAPVAPTQPVPMAVTVPTSAAVIDPSAVIDANVLQCPTGAVGASLRFGTEVFDFTDDDDVDIPLSNIDFEALGGVNSSQAVVVGGAVDLPRLTSNNSASSNSSVPLQISIPPPPPSSTHEGVGDLLTPRNSSNSMAPSHHHHLLPNYHHHHRSPMKRIFDVSPTILSRVDAIAAVEAVHSVTDGGVVPLPPLHQQHHHPPPFLGGSQQQQTASTGHNRIVSGSGYANYNHMDIMSDDTDTSLGGGGGQNRSGSQPTETTQQRIKLGKRRRQQRRMQESDGDGDTEDDQLEAGGGGGGVGGRLRDASLPGGRPKRTKTVDGPTPPSSAVHHLTTTRPSSAASGTSTTSTTGRELEDRRSGEEGRSRLPTVEEDDGKQSPDSQKSNEDKSR